MLKELEDLNNEFLDRNWLFEFNVINNRLIYIYKKNNDTFKICFDKMDIIRLSIPISIGNYKCNYDTTFKSYFMAFDYIVMHLNYYENKLNDNLSDNLSDYPTSITENINYTNF
jgi:hypothetical protein